MPVIRVGRVEDFAETEHKVFASGNIEFGIFRREAGRFVAYENRCPHMGGPVCQGKLFNRVGEELGPNQTTRKQSFSAERHIVCPWHGYEFDLDTGMHPGSRRQRLRRFEVELRGDEIYVHLPDRPTRVGEPMAESTAT